MQHLSRGAAVPAGIVFLALLFLPTLLPAQYFGRNKVQWEQFDWQVLKTEHFDIYYYPEEESAVRDTARMAERWYARLRQVFERDFLERKSIVLYADQSDFQQTTVVRGLIGQGTGGVTEGLRTRVVLPLTGNYEETDHVLGHELVHVFQYDILKDPLIREGGGASQAGGYDIPLWFIEGLAEYLSLGPTSPQTAMWLRDALARDELPDLRQISRDPRFFPYRWGHAFWSYVGGRWNDRTVGRLFTRGTALGLELALEETLGLTDEAFSDLWKTSIREAYAPVLEVRQTPKTLGARLLPQGEEDTIDTYIAPVVSPDGTEVIFFSTRSLFTFDLYLADAHTGQIKAKLLSADADPHFDALRFLDSAGSWSPDGRQFAFAVFAQGDNQLAILDVRSRDIERRYEVPNVGAIWNPAWSPDGRSIVFSGSAGGLSDLYQLDVQSGQVRQLTDDRFADLQPEWSPDGRTVAFVSDRGAGSLTQLTQEPMSIWSLDIASGQTRELVSGDEEAGNRINPQFGPGGRDLYFLSDREGVSDLYRMDMASGEIFRVTHLTTGVTGIARLSPALSVSETTGRVLFSVFHDTTYQIHGLDAAQARGVPSVPDPLTFTRVASLPPIRERATSVVAQYLGEPQPLEEALTDGLDTEEYRPKLSLDFVGPAVGVGVSTSGTAFGGDITAFFSDVLNQREVGFTLYGGSGSSFSEFGAEAYYLNQATRLQWGGAAGHIPYISAFTTAGNEIIEVDGQPVQARVIQQVREIITQDQAALISRYPLSSTRRLEASVGYTRLDFQAELFRVAVVGDVVVERSERDLPSPESLSFVQGTFAYVGDTSYFGFTSPVRGQRYRFEIEPTFGDLEFQSVLADYRRYIFWRPVTLAMRGLHFGRYGSDAESGRLSQLYLGRPTLVRGYEIDDISISDCTTVPDDPTACPEFDRLVGSRLGVLNLELRVPLLGTRGFGIFDVPFLPTELSAFVDAGVAWTSDFSPELRFDRDSAERVPVVSAGIAARVLLGGFAVLQFYYAKPFHQPDEDWVTGFVISPGW
ncbi:MAG TPA: BamA/TamA family outer membrane protein [Thermoanaerobaculia bacterium]|nr:BamA/TamA family outer membrane protein [Thermoanaerobaculia bacterium]